MLQDNNTVVMEFILFGFQHLHNYKFPLVLLIIIMYTATIAGNVVIIALVSTSHQLHSTMYTFLCHLSIADILISTNIAPNMLQVILLGRSSISARYCITQSYFFGASAIIESCLLTVMSYDRYLAICKPLHYTSIMSHKLPHYLVTCCWMSGFVLSGLTHILIAEFDFCGPNAIDHFFCDLAPLLELSCSDTSIVQIQVSIAVIIMGLFQLVFIIVTYICIFISILQISSVTGRKKTFSTCSAHLAVVCTYYGTMIILYMSPARGYSLNFNKALSFINSVVTPFFNPFIYTLRNKDIRFAIRKTIFSNS